MGKMIFGTNWKMNGRPRAEACHYAAGLREIAGERGADVSLFVIPPFTLIRDMAEVLRGSGVPVGAQNFHLGPGKEFTGEMSLEMAREAGAEMVLIGHAERRRYFQETDELLAEKLAVALAAGFQVVFCLGESREDRARGVTEAALRQQLETALQRLPAAGGRRGLLVAYEPQWAIGKGQAAASGQEVEQNVALVRRILAADTDTDTVATPPVPVLYGGSVGRANCESLARETTVDGLFVGREALDIAGFTEIIRAARAVRPGRDAAVSSQQ